MFNDGNLDGPDSVSSMPEDWFPDLVSELESPCVNEHLCVLKLWFIDLSV